LLIHRRAIIAAGRLLVKHRTNNQGGCACSHPDQAETQRGDYAPKKA